MSAGYEFVPRYRFIVDITNAQYAVVAFSADHNFVDGEIVSFRVTPPFGMSEMNNLQTQVLSHTDDTITVNIDSSFWTPFIYPVSGKVTPPVCVPSAAGLIPGLYTPTVNLQDCFDNVRT